MTSADTGRPSGTGRCGDAWRRQDPGAARPRIRRWLGTLALLAGLFGAAGAEAGTFDEFQVFDGRIAAPGGFDTNHYVVFGRRGRRGDGAPRNGVLVSTEIAYATAPWHEVSVYLPVAAEFSGDLFYGGAKMRNTFISPGAADRPFAYGLDVELRRESYRFAEADWGLTLRPIIDLRRNGWQLILNPGFETSLGRGGVAFVPATRVVRQMTDTSWVGLEHYYDPGRIKRWEHPRDQAQQVFVTTDFKLGEKLSLHLGVGHGLTRASDRWAGKVIIGIDF